MVDFAALENAFNQLGRPGRIPGDNCGSPSSRPGKTSCLTAAKGLIVLRAIGPGLGAVPGFRPPHRRRCRRPGTVAREFRAEAGDLDQHEAALLAERPAASVRKS